VGRLHGRVVERRTRSRRDDRTALVVCFKSGESIEPSDLNQSTVDRVWSCMLAGPDRSVRSVDVFSSLCGCLLLLVVFDVDVTHPLFFLASGTRRISYLGTGLSKRLAFVGCLAGAIVAPTAPFVWLF